MTISHIQSVLLPQQNTAAGSIVLPALAVAVGDLVRVGFTYMDPGSSGASSLAVSDSVGNVYTQIGTRVQHPDDGRYFTQQFYSVATAGGASVVVTGNLTVGLVGSYERRAAAAAVFRTTLTWDVSTIALAAGSGTGTLTSGTLTAASGEKVVSAYHGNASSIFTLGAGYTKTVEGDYGGLQHKIDSAALSETVTATNQDARPGVIGVAVFREAAEADTTAPTLSSPTGAGGTATGTGGITSNEAGTHYWQATTSATPLTIPTAPAAMTGWTSRSLTATAQTWSLSTLAAGTYYVHNAAEDATGNRTTTDVVSASFVVAAGTTPVAFTGTVPAQTGTVSTASTDLALALYFSGTQTPFAYTVFSGALPGGLSLNSSTGAITGTPTTAGSYSAVIRATDASSNTANTGTISWTIAAGLATTFTFTMTGAVSLTGLKYAIFEGVTPDVWVAPILKGANETTDANGVCTVSVTGLTTKLIGQLGSAFVTNSDGSASGGAQSATRRAAYYVGVFS